MAPQTAENAESATAEDESAASSTVDGEEQSGEESQELESQETDPDVILTRNTQKRFDELTATIRSQQEQLDAIKKGNSISVSSDPEPNADDYDDDVQYAAALGAWKGEQRAIKRFNDSQQESVRRQTQMSVQGKISAYRQRAAEVIKKDTGFVDTINSSLLQTQDANGNFTEATLRIMDYDNGPLIAKHIALNPELATRINRSSPADQAVMIERLSNQLSSGAVKIKASPGPIGSETTGVGLTPARDKLRHIDGATFE
jgi:hypothetical protein